MQSRMKSIVTNYRSLYILTAVVILFYIIDGLFFIFKRVNGHFFQLYPYLYEKFESSFQFVLLLLLYPLGSTINSIVYTTLGTLPTRKARTIALLASAGAKGIMTFGITLVLERLVQYFYQPSKWFPECNTICHVIFIIGIAWFFLQLIRTLEVIFTLQYSLLDEDLDFRRTYTHIVIIKRIAILLLAIITVAAIFMTFREVRNLGTGLLISTGILSTVFGLSSREPIEGLLRGIQLTIAQPIRLDDTIIVENQLGVVSAINLTHVNITLWNKQQLIVPVKYFLEKPFQNLTHDSKELIGTVILPVDYQIPVEPLRQKFYEYLRSNELGLWNNQVGLLEVTAIKEKAIELSLFISADDPDKLFKLECDIREKMLYTIQQTYPGFLPKRRVENMQIKSIDLIQ